MIHLSRVENDSLSLTSVLCSFHDTMNSPCSWSSHYLSIFQAKHIPNKTKGHVMILCCPSSSFAKRNYGSLRTSNSRPNKIRESGLPARRCKLYIQDKSLMKDPPTIVSQKRKSSACGADDVLRKTVTIVKAIKEHTGAN